ncbi:MAG: DUF2087 domain-containing protein [Cellulosilyticaceae bacterium]
MEENINELFWNASIEDIKKGYIRENDTYRCIICGEEFKKGEIFSIEGHLYDAKKTAQLHVENQHGSILGYMVNMSNSLLGITEIQKQLLEYLTLGNSDKEVAQKMGIHPSTVRNHKYRLREKEKQAKLFLALMELVQEQQNEPITQVEESKLHEPSKTAKMVDDRYNTTQAEREKIVTSYFDEAGGLKNYPAKEKKKIIVLEKIATSFSKGKIYSEVEINRILERIYSDYATLRRALIEYGFMDRDERGDNYWIKE